ENLHHQRETRDVPVLDTNRSLPFKQNAISISERDRPSSIAHASSGKKIASKIITPSHSGLLRYDNVTIREKGIARSLTFSPMGKRAARSSPTADDLMIEALEDMDEDTSNAVASHDKVD